MNEGGRGTGLVTLFGILLLIGSLVATGWWLRSGTPEADTVPLPIEGDVYCSGRVDAAGQVVALEPTQLGRVVAILVSEGATVRSGQEILRLDTAAAEARIAQATTAVETAQLEHDQAVRDKERLPGQLNAREALVKAAGARVEAFRKGIQQRQAQQQVTPLGKAELEALQAQLRELEQFEAAERAQLEDLKKIDPDLRVRAAKSRVQAAQSEHKLAERLLADCVLTAPTAGTVLRLQTAVGAILGPGSPVPPIVFAPAGPLIVRAEVDQENLSRVRVGMLAVVQDENRLDGPTWKGRVRDVARWVAPRRTYVLEPGELNDVRTVECVIELEPDTAEKLWIGQRMRVRILRDEPAMQNRSASALR